VIAKILFGLAAAYLFWRLWHGFGRPLPGTPKAPPVPPPPAGDDAEARALLGVEPGASPEDIRAAHRRLVSAVHPDRGGSAELTRRVNAARDRLLK
jgi:DnaJ homolog subfamily C member 19